MKDLLPHDHNAQRLSKQSFTLAEFFETQTPHYTPQGLNRKVVVHGHCHQKAIMSMSHEASLLKKMGADLELLDSGCCGMAGSFGFEKNKYQVSQTVFKHELQAHIETASQETILIADGFSCKTQIKQNSGREALHIAQVMKLALDQGQLENRQLENPAGLPRNDGYRREWITAGLATLLIGAALAWHSSKQAKSITDPKLS